MSENIQTTSPKSNGRGGARVGAGRKKGAATTRTREIADREMQAGLTPLEYMLRVMRSEPSPELAVRLHLVELARKNVSVRTGRHNPTFGRH